MGLYQLMSLYLADKAAGPTVSTLSNTILCAANSRRIEINESDANIWPWQTYQSSDVQPPVLSIEKSGDALSEGLLMFNVELGTTLPATKDLGPMIMTDSGDLIWKGPQEAGENLRTQQFNGAPVLTYFTGEGTAGASAVVGHGYGGVVVLDTSYNIVTTVCPQVDNFVMETGVSAVCHADVHESMITHRNTMLMTAYNTTPADLTAVGGPKNGWILDSLVLEVNITTGEILFGWSPFAHLPMNQSHAPLAGIGFNQTKPYDPYHVNSIELVGENYLINSRNYWSSFLVSPQGEILWEINGQNGGNFGSLPDGASFSWQHFARIHEIHSDYAIFSVFANNNGRPGLNTTTSSTGVTLKLPLPPNPATPPVLLTNLTDQDLRVDAWSQGSFEHQSNGNMLMGYGSDPVMIEYGPMEAYSTSPKPLWRAIFGHGNLVSSYRVYKQEWHATPSTQPNLVVAKAKSDDDLHCAGDLIYRGFVSWNGATDVVDWIVYAGEVNTSLSIVGRAKKSGFETEFVIPRNVSFIQVGALETNSSDVVQMSKVMKVA